MGKARERGTKANDGISTRKDSLKKSKTSPGINKSEVLLRDGIVRLKKEIYFGSGNQIEREKRKLA